MALKIPFLKLKEDGSLQLIRRLFAETGRAFAGRYALVVVARRSSSARRPR